jgi:signal transduction histidine kinase
VGRFELMLGEVDLARTVADVAAGLEAELARSGSTLQVHGERSLSGRWDQNRLEQIATNLLANAIKYGEGRPIDVTVSSDGDSATLLVSDHGIGIAPDMQRRIFERFERAVTGVQYGGLGLGLYVVQQLVHAHGGAVHLESTLGAGATFTVVLPRGGPPAEATALLGDGSSRYSYGH